MCLQRKTICGECKKDSDGLMKCTFVDGEEIYLCPDCLKADGSFCLSCGEFCSGLTNFDFIHPGYCDNCWDEIESSERWDEEEDEWNEHDEYYDAVCKDDDDYDDDQGDFGYGEYGDEDFPNGSLDY